MLDSEESKQRMGSASNPKPSNGYDKERHCEGGRDQAREGMQWEREERSPLQEKYDHGGNTRWLETKCRDRSAAGTNQSAKKAGMNPVEGTSRLP